ncbi:MAG TPA: molybdenum cofactor biosynthesis protein MoaE [Phycisphaerae bacterium]|nr:molybdenum cofactor biosynthesis protein MoaE [Phycisphaerae bacterium]
MSDATCTVTVAAFGSAAGVLGWPSTRVTLRAPARLQDLIDHLERECPRFAEGRGRVRYAVNHSFAGPETILNNDDEVAVIPPVSGGQPQAGPVAAAAWLTREPIDVSPLAAELTRPDAGAVASFVGVVRAERDAAGRELAALEYTAYEAMAAELMQSLCQRAMKEHAVSGVRLVHRLGRLGVGQASVVVVAAAAHRAAAFDACRALIEQLKQDVPIFKRELWQDGSASWVDPI